MQNLNEVSVVIPRNIDFASFAQDDTQRARFRGNPHIKLPVVAVRPDRQVSISVLEDPISAPPEWQPAKTEITYQRVKITQTRIAERVTAV